MTFYLADTLILGVDPHKAIPDLPSLFAPPLSPPTNYQTEGSGAGLVTYNYFVDQYQRTTPRRVETGVRVTFSISSAVCSQVGTSLQL